jgi:hypothetical protein
VAREVPNVQQPFEVAFSSATISHSMVPVDRDSDANVTLLEVLSVETKVVSVVLLVVLAKLYSRWLCAVHILAGSLFRVSRVYFVVFPSKTEAIDCASLMAAGLTRFRDEMENMTASCTGRFNSRELGAIGRIWFGVT